MASLLVRGLQTMITCDDSDSVLEHVDLYCEDGVIRAIGPDLPQSADTVIDGSSCWAHRPLRDLEGTGRGDGAPELPHRHGRADEARLHHLL